MTDEQMLNGRGMYRILVKGTLDQRWADWFDGLTISPQADDETLLTGLIVDQAALHGMLSKIRDLSLPLSLVVRVGGEMDCPCPKTKCPRRGQCEECQAYHGAKGKLPYCLRKRTKRDKLFAGYA
jgi:hypothetical protein